MSRKLLPASAQRAPSRRLRLLVLLLVSAAPLPAAGALPAVTSEAQAVAPSPGAEAKTMAAMRELGTALYSWLVDRMDATTPEEQKRLVGEARAAERASGPRKRGIYVWGWRPVRPLTGEEIAALLKPAEGRPYLAEIPRLDGWARPFELMGWPENVFNAEVFAIRSAGPNGRFEGPRYEEGTWSVGAMGDDIVWADGFFVRWPDSEAGND